MMRIARYATCSLLLFIFTHNLHGMQPYNAGATQKLISLFQKTPQTGVNLRTAARSFFCSLFYALQEGADPNAVMHQSPIPGTFTTPLIAAIKASWLDQYTQLNAVYTLLNWRANPNMPEKTHPTSPICETPLYTAFMVGNMPAADLLLKNGAAPLFAIPHALKRTDSSEFLPFNIQIDPKELAQIDADFRMFMPKKDSNKEDDDDAE